MADKLRLLTDNLVDSSVITANPGTATGIDNLKSYNRTSIFTSNSVPNSQIIDLVLASDSVISAVILGRHSFPVGTEFTITLYSDAAWTTPVHTSPTLVIGDDEAGSSVTPWGSFLWGVAVWGSDTAIDNFELQPTYAYYLSAVTARSIRIEVQTPTSEIEISRLIIGDYIEPRFNISYGHSVEWRENTKQYRQGGNSLRSVATQPTKRFKFSLNTIVEEDRDKLQDGLRYVGLRKDLFISLFPENADSNKIQQYSSIVKLIKIPRTSEYAHMYYKSQYEMEEV